MSQPTELPDASVIIPAHNEERTVSRLLQALCSPADLNPQILVVCNGCTDSTADLSRSFSPSVTTVEIDTPSKRLALQVGDDYANSYPRIFVDADVVISRADVARLVTALGNDSVLACAPTRSIPRDGMGWIVRWYYDVWERLPQVRDGLFGRGVIALSEPGMRRLRQLPPMMSDDLVMSEAFSDSERLVVEGALVTIFPPRKARDLLRRRIRAITGNYEADRAGLRSGHAKTSVGTLARLVQNDFRLAPKMAVFMAIWAISKLGSRRAIKSGDFTTWRRDESSRE